MRTLQLLKLLALHLKLKLALHLKLKLALHLKLLNLKLLTLHLLNVLQVGLENLARLLLILPHLLHLHKKMKMIMDWRESELAVEKIYLHVPFLIYIKVNYYCHLYPIKNHSYFLVSFTIP